MGDEGDRVAGRFARGCRAFAVTDAGDLVAYGWLSTGPEWVGELSVTITPVPGEAYIWNCLTLPEHRRRGHYHALLDGIVAQSRREGLSRLWIGSVEDPAEKANTDTGFVPVASVTIRRFGGLRLLRARPVAGAGARLATTARQRLGQRSWTSLTMAAPRKH